MEINQQQNTEPLYVMADYYKTPDYEQCNCVEIILWILSVVIWLSIVYCFFRLRSLIYIIIFYVIYLIIQFKTLHKFQSVFFHPKSVNEMNTIMSCWFRAIPSIKFIRKVYEESIVENEQRSETTLKLKGTETENFAFSSSRDVSGPIIFNKEYYSYIYFIPIPDIRFADRITYSDYEKEKSDFQKDSSHASGDKYKYSEERTIPGLKKEGYLINIYDSTSCFIRKSVFIIFIILSFGL